MEKIMKRLLEFDIHYESDQPGSRWEYVK